MYCNLDQDCNDLFFHYYIQINRYPVRFAGLLAGIPNTTPVETVNRLCSSGLEAVAIVASKI